MNRGFANIALIIVLVVIVAGGAGYWVLTKQPTAPATSETMQLPSLLENINTTNQPPVKTSAPTTQATPNQAPIATNPLYVDSTFGVSFQYPKGFSETKKQVLWTSKEAYLAWLDSPASNTGGIGVNNIVSIDDGNDAGLLIIILSVAPLDRYNAYDTMYSPETDQSFVVNGVKVYKTVRGSNTDFYWQNSHKSSLETLWNALSISGISAADVSPVAALIQGTLSIK